MQWEVEKEVGDSYGGALSGSGLKTVYWIIFCRSDWLQLRNKCIPRFEYHELDPQRNIPGTFYVLYFTKYWNRPFLLAKRI